MSLKDGASIMDDNLESISLKLLTSSELIRLVNMCYSELAISHVIPYKVKINSIVFNLNVINT